MKLKKVLSLAIFTSSFLLISLPTSANERIDGPNVTIKANENTDKENQIKIDKLKSKEEKLKMLNSLSIDDIASWSDFNASEYGIVTPVITQGQKNTCWAHAIASASETSILKEGLYPSSSYLRVGPDNIAYQAFNRISENDPLSNASADVYESYYDRGNQISKGVERLTAWNGIHLVDTDFKYTDEGFYTPDFLLEESITIDSRDILDIKKAISEYGAVTMFYNYSPYQDNFYNPLPNTNDTHAVSIIGWDDNIDPSLFSVGPTPKRAGGWLCKNSWGEGYGTNGLFYLSYDALINDVIALDYMKYDSKLLNYYYDGFTEDNSYLLDEAAVIYEAKGEDDYNDEYLENINVKLHGTNLKLKVDIYLDAECEPSNRLSKLNKPRSGSLAMSFNYEVLRGGSRMIPLPKPLKLKRGQYFSIVISVSGNDSGIIMSKEDFSYNDLSYYNDNGVFKSTFYNNNGVARIKGITRLKEKSNPKITNDIKYAYIFKERDYIKPGDGLYTIKPKIKYNGRELYENKDYVLTYTEEISMPSDLSNLGTNIGKGVITVTGINDFLGTATRLYYTIIIGEAPDFTALGESSIYNTYDIEVDSSKKRLSDIELPYNFRWSKDEDIRFNETIPSAVEYIGPDKDRYKFNVRDVYITRSNPSINIADAKIIGLDDAYSYNGSYIRPNITLNLNGYPISEGDYRVEYINNVDVGIAKVIVRGKGNYYGRIEKEFKIEKAKTYISSLSYINNTPSAIGSFSNLEFKYFLDSECKNEVKSILDGEYYLKAYLKGNDNYNSVESKPLKIVHGDLNKEIKFVINIKTKTKGLLLNKMPHIIIKNKNGDIAFDEFVYATNPSHLKLELMLPKDEYEVYLEFNNDSGYIYNRVSKISLEDGKYPYDKEGLYPSIDINVNGSLLPKLEEGVKPNYTKGDIINDLKYIDSKDGGIRYISDSLSNNKYALIVIFKVGCPYGNRALRALNKLAYEYSDSLDIIASSNKAYGIDEGFYSMYPNLIFTEGYNNSFYDHFNNQGELPSPTFCLIDPDGFFVERLEGGSKSDEKMELILRNLLKGYISPNEAIYSLSLESYDYYYTGSEIKPEVILTLNGNIIDNSKLKISYTNNIDCGKAIINLSGIGFDYNNTISFNILKAENEINDLKIINGNVLASSKFGSIKYEYYDNNNQKLEAFPKLPGSYIIKAYVDESNNYSYIEKEISYVIDKFSINRDDIKIINNKFIYDGKAKNLEVEIISNGIKLNKDIDFTLTNLDDGINVGVKRVIAKGIGSYSFNYELEYEIIKAKNELTLNVNDSNIEAKALFEDVIIKYYSDSDCKNEITKPTKKGKYFIKAFSVDSSNYEGMESDVVSFEIKGDNKAIIISSIAIASISIVALIGVIVFKKRN